MHDNAKLIETFYTAFGNRDAETMAGCYHDDATFTDPAFVGLDANGVRNMWRMLVERGKDLEIQFSGVEADDQRGKAHWVATYTFSATGRKVKNEIDATFEFKDGKISKHTDSFDFWKWTRMALGPSGTFLGWSGFMKNKVRSQAMSGLRKFIDKRG
ncbi:MAG: nuclear transport factor 2 family protein [Myxococcota bacterium]